MLDRLESERRESARRALLVQERERRRIARELHDEVGQTLTGVMLQVEGLAAVIPEELREQLDELRETARDGTEEVRRIARRLRPEALEDLGLQSALARSRPRSPSRRRLRIERRLDSRLPLSEEQELVVYRVAQEALTNVARHADAPRCRASPRERRHDGGRSDGSRRRPRTCTPGTCPRPTGSAACASARCSSERSSRSRDRPSGGTEVQLSIPLDPVTT